MTTYTGREREIVGSPFGQGRGEQIARRVDVSRWGNTPTNPAVRLYLVDSAGTKTDVSNTNLSGNPSVSGNLITLPKIINLTPGATYRLEIDFTIGGNVEQAWAKVIGEE